MTPNIDDIRRDDELLDLLGSRAPTRGHDALTDALGTWVRDVDEPDRALPAGRYARARRGSARVGIVAAITLGTLSVSGVAAAVSGVPGISQVAHNIGFQHRSADFGSGAAAGPLSTRAAAPSTGGLSSTSDARDPSTSTQNATGIVGPPATTHAAPTHENRRSLPGAIIGHSAPERHGGTGAVSTSSSVSSSSRSSTTHSLRPSTSSTSMPTTSTPSTSRSHSRRPQPTRSPRPTRPVWSTQTPSPTTSSPKWKTNTSSSDTMFAKSHGKSNSLDSQGYSNSLRQQDTSRQVAPKHTWKKDHPARNVPYFTGRLHQRAGAAWGVLAKVSKAQQERVTPKAQSTPQPTVTPRVSPTQKVTPKSGATSNSGPTGSVIPRVSSTSPVTE